MDYRGGGGGEGRFAALFLVNVAAGRCWLFLFPATENVMMASDDDNYQPGQKKGETAAVDFPRRWQQCGRGPTWRRLERRDTGWNAETPAPLPLFARSNRNQFNKTFFFCISQFKRFKRFKRFRWRRRQGSIGRVNPRCCDVAICWNVDVNAAIYLLWLVIFFESLKKIFFHLSLLESGSFSFWFVANKTTTTATTKKNPDR